MNQKENEVIKVMLEWSYSPNTFLEEPLSFNITGACLTIENGKAVAEIDPPTFHNNTDLKDELSQFIESRLYAVQVMSHQAFKLSKPSRTDIHKDGKKNFFVEVNSAIMVMNTGSADIIVKDKDGNIIVDSKRDRLNQQEWFFRLINKYRTVDDTLDKMLKSYNASVKDPDNELVHLYEIRDALSQKFGSKKEAIKHLKITSKEWNEIGELANDRPIKQGRHRGKFISSLRNASVSELKQARNAVRNFVEKYLLYLESLGSK